MMRIYIGSNRFFHSKALDGKAVYLTLKLQSTDLPRRLACIALIFFGVSQTSLAQRTGDNDIQDSVIGWWNQTRFDHFKPRTDPIGQKKEVIVNDMVKWMKASYTPVGGLGTSSRYAGSRGYGVNFLVWNVSHDKEWTEPNGNFKPIAEENTKFAIAANQLFGAFPIYFINGGNEYYFTIQPDGYGGDSRSEGQRKDIDPRIHPNVHKYVTRMNDWCTVYLAPENKLPWTPVTRGELLQKAEDGLQKVLADKRKEVASQWPNSQKSQDEALDVFTKGDIEKYRKKINDLRTRYAGSLNEKATIRDMQPTMYSFETDPDIFKTDQHRFEVFKLDAATMAKVNDVTPLWVAVAFPFETKERGNQLYEMFTAMSQNINYDYIYNYFYDPEKIRGKTYTPADPEGLKARLDGYRSTTSVRQRAIAKNRSNLPANVVLFDDFSGDEVGGKAKGWYYKSFGTAHAVRKVDGESGNWLELGYNNELTPATLKALPENFSLEYDLVTSKFDGRWGAAVSMEMKGAKKGTDGVQYASKLMTSITAGNQSALDAKHDYRGEVRIDLENFPSKMNFNEKGGYFVGPQPVFTNTKRKVHVQLLKKNQNLTLLLNGKELTNSSLLKSKYGKPCGDCNFPEGLVYNSLVIKSITQDADTVHCYIGNIKITKLNE